jgi:hypothetical protein
LARFYIFYIFSNKIPVLGDLYLGGHHLLDPPGHGVTQPLAEVLGDAPGPQELDLLDQLGHRAGVLLQQILPHEGPHALNGLRLGLFCQAY